MRYVFHPEALNDYTEAVQYYANQRVAVAQAFISAIEDTVYRIRESPTRYAVIDEDVRRCMARRFPYDVLYTIQRPKCGVLSLGDRYPHRPTAMA